MWLCDHPESGRQKSLLDRMDQREAEEREPGNKVGLKIGKYRTNSHFFPRGHSNEYCNLIGS